MKYLTIAFLLFAFIAKAQKLTETKQISLRAPADVKIDGKATELKDTFQALNHNCDVYYTISNDDNNLYLTVQATDPAVIKRIINGGITLSVSTSGKKSDKGLPGVTFPVFNENPGVNVRKASSEKEADSLMNVYNKKLRDKEKNIRTSGIKGVDTLISVYNEDSIEAMALYNNKFAYTCEISVALKHFGLSTDRPVLFAYHVMINEVAQHGIDIKKDANGNIMSININKGAQMGQPATDFWGEYTLAKK